MTVFLSFYATESHGFATLKAQNTCFRSCQSLDNPLSSVLAPTLDNLWKQVDYTPLDWLIVPRGPLPFTTLRILLATAQGLVLGSPPSLQVFSPTHFEIMAYQAYQHYSVSHPLLILLESKRHELYGQVWKEGQPFEEASLWSKERIYSYQASYPETVFISDGSWAQAHKIFDSTTPWSDCLLDYFWKEKYPGGSLSLEETSLKPYYVHNPIYVQQTP